MAMPAAQIPEVCVEETGVSPNTLVCGCLTVHVDDVQRLQRAGPTTSDNVADALGVGSACGACWQRLVELTGDPGGVPAQMTHRVQLDTDVFLCRFEIEPGHAFSGEPRTGQHCQVAVKVEANPGWACRPYTLVSGATGPGPRQIMVRRHGDGEVSSRLTSGVLPIQVRLGRPAGYGFSMLRKNRPVVFLAAGIGITPALSYGSDPDAENFHTLFIGRSPSDALRSLLKRSLATNGRTLKIHDTAEKGRISEADLAKLVSRHRRAEWCICGPAAFMSATRATLQSLGIRSDRIHEEFFSLSTKLDGPAPARPRLPTETRIHRVGWCLLTLWATVIVAPEWMIPDTLQQRPVQLATGGVLLLFLLGQWLLPLIRLRQDFALSARVEHWHRDLGVASIFLGALHIQQLGHGLHAVLGLVFVGSLLLGLVDKTVIRSPVQRAQWMKFWLPAHILGAFISTGLAIWHGVLMLSYSGFSP